MDLCLQLARKINQSDDITQELKVSHLSQDIDFGIYALPGSRVIEEDWDGVQEKLLPIEIALKTDDGYLAESTLYKVSELLDSLTELPTDGTYFVNQIDIQPQPFLAGVGIDEKPMYLLDFNVLITTKNTQEKI